MKPFDYNAYLRNNPLLKESINEATVRDLIKPLRSKLESMGYEVDVDPTFGFPMIKARKTLPDGSVLQMYVEPSEEEIQNRIGQPVAGETIDVEFNHWTREVVKRFFGLLKTKGDYDVKRLPDQAGRNIDLGTGMFDIPVEQSVERVISLLKKAEQKVGVGTPTRQMTGDADADFMGEGFNLFKKMKDYAGEQGWTFSARRPTEEEDEIGREYMRSQGKELGSIGVDRLTGNINVMEPNGDFRAILSSDGEELSAYEMDIHENLGEDKKESELKLSGPDVDELLDAIKFLNNGIGKGNQKVKLPFGNNTLKALEKDGKKVGSKFSIKVKSTKPGNDYIKGVNEFLDDHGFGCRLKNSAKLNEAAEKDIEIDIDSAEQITLKGKELDSDKLGTNKKYRDIILKAPDKAFMYKGKPVSITAVDLNDGSVDEPKIYLTVLNESTKTIQTLKSTKPGDKLTLVLDDDSTVTVVRVGTNKSGEPTFKHIKNNKEVGTASALSASHIKSVK